jgi:hypothetical protein
VSVAAVGSFGLAFLLLAGWTLVRLARAAARQPPAVVAEPVADAKRPSRRPVVEEALHA